MAGALKEINIKYDMPVVDEAIRRIALHIKDGKSSGIAAIKIIHGYGSTGKGGKIRIAARQYLESQKSKNLIRDYIAGEDFSIFNEATRRAFLLCDGLRCDHDLDHYNNGITIIIL
ncbi:MAG: Smr/MutS family protein [Clostridiales bacterium]|jgi:hypothetical protein|nr:Smr/MutS family protein [Clostridiales bacterium]